jgi:hypothetical protein
MATGRWARIREVTDYFHVSSSLNRASIERHGLDWRLMGAAPGIAGSRGPEEQGIFLVTDAWDVEWFAQMGLEAGHASIDVWRVSLPSNMELSNGAEYPLITEPIPPEAIALHQKDWTARDPGAVIWDLFHAIYYGDGSLDAELVGEEVLLVEVDGARHQGFQALETWARERAHGQPARPKSGPERQVIGGEAGYTIEGIDDGDDRRLVSSPAEKDYWMLVLVEESQVVEVREFRSARRP